MSFDFISFGFLLLHDHILLMMFLDNTAAFDKTLHPIILSHLFNGGIEDDMWRYFQLLHKNASTHIKWNGRVIKMLFLKPLETDKEVFQVLKSGRFMEIQ